MELGETEPSRSSDSFDNSDDDDDIADMREFQKLFQSRTPESKETASAPLDDYYSLPTKRSRLDDLLFDHKKDLKRCIMKQETEELMEGNETDSQELSQHSQSLASELEDHLDKLNVSTVEVDHVQPGMELFSPSNYCCLFTETTSPADWGFTSSNSAMDRAILKIKPGSLSTLLTSQTLVVACNSISNLDSVLIWLLNLLSVEPSSIEVYNIHSNLLGMLKKISEKDGEKRCRWYPQVLELLRIFVNYGADYKEMMGTFSHFSDEEVRKVITSKNDASLGQEQDFKGQIKKENVRKVLEILASVFRLKPKYCKDDISLLLFMLLKAILDPHLLLSVRREVQVCVDLLLSCYSDEDWPQVVLELCKHLRQVTDNHHNRRQLLRLLTESARGTFLKMRLSFVFLCDLLVPDNAHAFDDALLSYSLSWLPSLGQPVGKESTRKMALSFQKLIRTDAYKFMSAVVMLDLAVGDLYRSAQDKKNIEELISEVNSVLKSIKDSIHNLEMSKIKDALTRIKDKWSLTFQNNQMTSQRRIFHYMSSKDEQHDEEMEVAASGDSDDECNNSN